jgi:DnaJ-domain-containing protein 1
MNFFPSTPLEKNHAEAIARGLFAIAKADGIHQREAALIASFWADAGGNFSALSQLERGADITSAELGATLNTPELRQMFLKTALLMAFADGEVSTAESQLVRQYAADLGFTEQLGQLEAQVKDFLLSQLSHIHNTAGLAEVAKKLAI